MDCYLVICKDTNLIETPGDLLSAGLASYLKTSVRALTPVMFAEYSCLTRYVWEEIDLVVSNQERLGEARMSYDEFIQYWGWPERLDQEVRHLSGGWRKVLCLTLFLNRQGKDVLIADFATHLSDETMEFLLERSRGLGLRTLTLMDYDPTLLLQLIPVAISIGYDGNGFRALSR